MEYGGMGNMGGNPFYAQQRPQVVTRYVGSIEEAKACVIDPLNIWLFINMSAGEIYMKHMTNYGSSDFTVFVPQGAKKEGSGTALEDRVAKLEEIVKAMGVKDESESV